MHAHASRATAEAAAVGGLQSSPDTQECRVIFAGLMGRDFETVDSEVETTLEPNRACSSVPQPSRDKQLWKKAKLPKCVQQAVLGTPHHSPSPTKEPLQLDSVQTSLTSTDQHHHQEPQPRAHLPPRTQHNDKGWLSNADLADGILSRAEARAGNMEEIMSQLYSSDGSNLSKTQENDPAVYERFLMNNNSAATTHLLHSRISAAQDTSSHAESGFTAPETARSYAPDDTGHLTLDYKPPPMPMEHSSEENGLVDISHVPQVSRGSYGTVDNPQTPSQPRPNLGRPGTMMKLSQMFAETQPSPGSRGLQTVLTTSSRPSPDLFGHQRTPKDMASSPLLQRGGKTQGAQIATFNLGSSSPNVPLNLAVNQPDFNQMSQSEGVLVHGNGANMLSHPTSHIPHFPEPYDTYIPRKESQDRRMKQAHALKNGSQSSDDDFSDSEMERNRRAKLKKEQAAKTLAIIGASRLVSSGNEVIEVPSTIHDRRRSQADEYVVQCMGYDARDSQEDDTVTDSQSVPISNMRFNTKNSLQARSKNLNRPGSDNSRSRSMPDTSVALPDGLHIGSSGQLPGLDENSDSDVTESDGEVSPALLQWPATQPFEEVPSNIADLRTPAVIGKVLAVDSVAMVPETSPSEAHLHKYGEIVSQTPPALSTEDSDDVLNIFTQDAEFKRILSPSPQKRMRSRRIRSAEGDTKTKLEHDPAHLMKSGSEKHLSSTAASVLAGVKDSKLDGVLELNSKFTAQEDNSEYLTALTNLPAETNSEINSAPVGQQNMKINRHIERPIWSPISSPLLSAPQEDENNSEIHTDDGQAEVMPLHSHRLSMSMADHQKDRSAISSNNNLDQTAGELPVEIPTKPRSADQLKDSMKVLRRVALENKGSFYGKASDNVTPVPTVQRFIRTSGRVNEKAKSADIEEPATPVLLTRRKIATNKPLVVGIFAKMAFSVSYGNRDDEKDRIIRLIKQNGGRVLEKGFDELFEMTATEMSLSATSLKNNDEVGENNLVLTAEATSTTFACLIAGEHSRRAKFMQALALGLPCLSGRWIEHCVTKGYLLDWDVYLLASGESSFLGGAVRNRNLQPYPAATAKFSKCIEQRLKLLSGKSILIVMGRGRAEERKRAYLFLTQALGARRVRRVQTNQEARKVLLEAETNGEEYNWVYVDDDERDAERIIFGVQASSAARKRKRRGSTDDVDHHPPPKKVKVISDEFVIQSLILGKLIEED